MGLVGFASVLLANDFVGGVFLLLDQIKSSLFDCLSLALDCVLARLLGTLFGGEATGFCLRRRICRLFSLKLLLQGLALSFRFSFSRLLISFALGLRRRVY